MPKADQQDLQARIDEADEARRARERRDAALTAGERLARVDALCRQLSAIRPIRPRQD